MGSLQQSKGKHDEKGIKSVHVTNLNFCTTEAIQIKNRKYKIKYKSADIF